MIQRSSTWTRGHLLLLAGAFIVVESLIAGRLGFAAFEWRRAVLTVLAGWVMAACGLAATRTAPASRTGALLFATAMAWYLGSFDRVAVASIAGLATAMEHLYLALMAHAVMTFPDGRIANRRVGLIVGALYVLAIVPLPAGTLAIGLALGAALMARRWWAPVRPPRQVADAAGGLLAVGLVVGPVVPAMTGGIVVSAILPLTLMVGALILTAGLSRTAAAGARMTDLVLDLGASVDLTASLRIAAGDPTLEVGVWLPEEDRYVDPMGRTVTVPLEGSGRAVMMVERNGLPNAVVLQDLAQEQGSALRAAVTRAAELAAINTRLEAELRAQVADVQASRRRLVDAADEEHRALERRFRHALTPRLEALDQQVSELADHDRDDPLRAVRQQLTDVREELSRLIDGLHPQRRWEHGLSGALAELARRSQVPVDLEMHVASPAPRALEATLYFVCSEALTNVVKHARASRVFVGLAHERDRLRLEISDNGVGGADPAAGTGLSGLRDRIETQGGTFALQSHPGSGTRLIVDVPMSADA